MSAKILEFPVAESERKENLKTNEASSIEQPKKNVRRIDEIKREEERANEMFPPNYLMLIA